MNKVKIDFSDLTFNTVYEFLEEGSSKELKTIAQKRGVVLPSPDISVLKGRYALVDKENKNKCTLPKEEVEKALATLIGKQVDIDHLRKTNVGWWMDSYLEGDEIISYAAFWKASFGELYDDFKTRMKKGEVKISFEAWGNREFKENGSYNLKDIHFCGGALLDSTDPAFPEAQVLEFATIMENGTKNERYIELAKFTTNDFDKMMRLMDEVECASCKAKYSTAVNSINFDEGKLTGTCYMCGAKMAIDVTPKVEMTKKGRIIKSISTIQTKEESNTQVNGGKEMDEKVKELSTQVTSLTAQLEEAKTKLAEATSALEKSNTVISELRKESEEAKAKIDSIEKEVASKIEKAKKEATLIAERKADLGSDYSKDMKDEDILDDLRFELAKTKKELALVKASVSTQTKETASTQKVETEMSKGTKDKANKEFEKQKLVTELAFGR
jgi:hypothetical protein